jgi:hypothetical protein
MMNDSLWFLEPAFGYAGGPDVAKLTPDGLDLACLNALGVGGRKERLALEHVGAAQQVTLSVRRGSCWYPHSEEFPNHVWWTLVGLGFVVKDYQPQQERICITQTGVEALDKYHAEIDRLLSLLVPKGPHDVLPTKNL